MPEIQAFIVLEGLLYESGAFEVGRVFEDTTAAKASRFDDEGGVATVMLVDADGRVLHRVTPPVHFPSGCTSEGTMVAQGLIRAAVAHHDEARKIELRVVERVVFSADIAPNRPDVRVSAKLGKQDTLEVVVDGEPAEVRVIARLTDGRRLGPVVRRDGDTYAVDLRSLEGLGQAEILIEATRACRTTRVLTATVELPEATVTGLIVEPRPNAEWPWGRRGSLIGTLSDRNGRRIEWDEGRVGWLVDGQILEDRKQIVDWQSEQAGDHRVELVLDLGGGQIEVLDERIVRVREQTAEQKEWMAVVAAFRHRLSTPG